MAINELLTFVREWGRSPRDVAAVAPSGHALASLITRKISPATGPVLELGPGTGAFTRALLRRGVSEDHLTLIEVGRSFADLLREKFPSARVLQMRAEVLSLQPPYLGNTFGAVVCGLGFLNMPRDTVFRILSGAFLYLQPHGEFFMFTYGATCSVPEDVLGELGLRATRLGKTYLNFPPATVYSISRCNDEVPQP
ncbi:methyltransferase domain-containing protein [Pandoraea pnomenusa]|uniref:class I SAM-dependent methyltransferase n=1 Tax=Pandoraea pnomenusa TaxID=93220 RepID=UPI00333E9040